MQTSKRSSVEIPLSLGLQNPEEYCKFLSSLNERQRRHCVGLEAQRLGYGGISRMSRLTGMHANTIIRGIKENKAGEASDSDGRVRAAGAGRPLIEIKYPSIQQQL